MKAQEVLNKIKGIVGVELAEEVNLAEMKLQNGTVIEAEKFEKGEAVFIKSDDEKIALPVGEYILEDGRLLVVEEEGLIADMRDVSDDVPAKEEEMSEETNLMPDDEAAVYDWAGMEKRIKNLEIAVAKLKEAKEGGDDKVEAAKEEVKEELSTEVELSSETVEPIKHSPEVEDQGFKFEKNNYPKTLQARIYEKLNN
tara:strand:- start:929 stop:1522 length:594 start_codon:yes stop_codon:yes gene_type:complete